MFGLFRKKTQLEQHIAKDGIEHAAERFAEILSRKLPTREIAYQFILEELDGASQGNAASQRFAQSSGIPPEEYEGALSNSNPDVDGPGGPQQLLLALSLELVNNQALMAEFRCKVDDKIMRRFSLGKYAGSVVPTQIQETRVVGKSHDVVHAAPEKKGSLIDIVEKKHATALGLFEDLNRDLGSYIEENEHDDPLRKMAYAYARRTAIAGLYFQGIQGQNAVKYVQDIFVGFQLTTGQTIEFQREAARQATELVASYVPRLTRECESVLFYYTREGTTAVELAKNQDCFDIDPFEDDPVSIDKCLDLIETMLETFKDAGLNTAAKSNDARQKTLIDVVEKASTAKLGAFASMCDDVKTASDKFVGDDILFASAGYALILGACGTYVAGGVNPKLITDYCDTAKTLMADIGGNQELHRVCKKQAVDLASTYVHKLSHDAAEVIMETGLKFNVFAEGGKGRMSPEQVVQHAGRIARDTGA